MSVGCGAFKEAFDNELRRKKGYMRTILCKSFLFGCLGFLTAGGSAALAQAPGGHPESAPAQRPSASNPNADNAGMNNPDGVSARKMDDKKFVKDAAMGGMTEVELGKLAAQKATRDDVKQFGQKMVDDHTKANDQLKEIATKSSMEVPSSLDAKHQSRIDKLSALSGAAFDKAYVKDEGSSQDVTEFQSEAQSGSDPNVKQLAASTLPTLQEHLSMVKDLNKKSK